MGKEVSAAIGTQRQFAKQPELPYQMQLSTPSFGSGINPRTRINYDAQALAHALGVMPRQFGAVMEAIDKGQQENAKTLINADKIFAGKTKEDLKIFDSMMYLQNVEGHNMSNNKYAMAILEQGMGRMASTYAKQEWANMPESQKPNSVEEQVQLFQKKLQDNYGAFDKNIHNRQAFDEGYFHAGMNDTLKVAEEASQRINDVKKQQMVMLGSADLQDAMYSGLTGDEFKNVAHASLNKIAAGCAEPKAFLNAVTPLMGVVGEKDFTTERLNALGDYVFMGKKVRDMVSLAPFYKKVAANFDKRVAEDIYNKSLMPDGSLNMAVFNAELAKLPKEFTTPGIPQIELSATNPTLLKNLDSQTQSILPSIGGVLSMLGVGDAMSVTSANGGELGVYVGTPNQETRDRIVNNMSQCFNHVSFTDDGQNYTLHLSGYKGGLDNKADSAELSASAFSPDRIQHIKQLAGVASLDRKNKSARAKEASNRNTLRKVIGALSTEDAIASINDSELSPEEKERVTNLIIMHNTPLTKKQLNLMTKEDKHYYDYSHSPADGLPSQYARDIQKVEAIEQMSAEEKEQLKDSEYSSFIKALKNVNNYKSYCRRNAIDVNADVYTSSEDIPTADETESASYEEIKNALKDMVANEVANGTDEQTLRDKISSAGSKVGLSLEDCNRLEDELLDGGGLE